MSEMSETLTMSQTVGTLTAALAKAQAAFGPIKTTETANAGQYAYSYAPLHVVIAATRPALNAAGIAVVQGVTVEGGRVRVETRLCCGEEWIACSISAVSDQKIQQVGGTISYLRRYSYNALTCIAPEDAEDDDAQEKPTPPKPKPVTKAHPAERLGPSELLPPKVVVPTVEHVDYGTVEAVAKKGKPVAKAKDAAPLDGGSGITAQERGLLFKVAKQQSFAERDVKLLISMLFGYVSTSQIQQGAEFGKVLAAMENPKDHGVSIGEDGDLLYSRAADPNALPERG